MQAFDYEAQVEANRCFRMRLRNNLQKACESTRHDPIDVIRTALWYGYIEQCLGTSKIYQVEKHIEPNAFGKNSHGDPHHRNKWSAYRVGGHKPNRSFIEQVEQKIPGSSYFIDHVLWVAMRGRKKLDWLLNKGLRQLGRDVQKVLYKESHPGIGDRLCSQLSMVHLRQLERRAGLDALAALVIFLRLANEKNEGERALEIGQSIYRVLLIWCTHIPFFDFCAELFLLFRFYVFSIARDEHVGVAADVDFDFRENVCMLVNLHLQLEDQNLIGMSYRDSLRAMYELLDGRWGFHIRFALAPPISLLAPPSELNTQAQDLVARERRYREWGWKTIRVGGKERLPPDEIW